MVSKVISKDTQGIRVDTNLKIKKATTKSELVLQENIFKTPMMLLKRVSKGKQS